MILYRRLLLYVIDPMKKQAINFLYRIRVLVTCVLLVLELVDVRSAIEQMSKLSFGCVRIVALPSLLRVGVSNSHTELAHALPGTLGAREGQLKALGNRHVV